MADQPEFVEDGSYAMIIDSEFDESPTTLNSSMISLTPNNGNADSTMEGIPKKRFKVELTKLVKSGDSSIKLLPVPNKRAPFWIDFKIVEKCGRETPFVACVHCKTLLTYKTDKQGCTTHKNHSNDCQEKKRQLKQPSVEKVMYKVLPFDQQKQLDRHVALAAAIDLRPFSFARCEGMIEFLQFLVTLASTHGNFNVKEYLPYGTTVANSLGSIKLDTHKQMSSRFQKVPAVAAIADHWASKFNRNKFLGIAAR